MQGDESGYKGSTIVRVNTVPKRGVTSFFCQVAFVNKGDTKA